MAVYPNNQRTAEGWLHTCKLYGRPHHAFYNGNRGAQLGMFTALSQKSSIPDGYHRVPIMPIEAGGLSAYNAPIVLLQGVAQLISGGLISGTASVATLGNTNSLSTTIALQSNVSIVQMAGGTTDLKLSTLLDGSAQVVALVGVNNLRTTISLEGSDNFLSFGNNADLLMALTLDGNGNLTLTGSGDLSQSAALSGVGQVTSITGSSGLTLGSSLAGVANITFAGASSLSIWVPFDGTGTVAQINGTLNLKGNLALEGEWTPFTELSPENLARSVWESMLASYPTVGSAGNTLRLAGLGGGGGGGSLTPEQAEALDLVLAAVAGKAVISPDGSQIDLYAPDGTTILRSLSLSPDLKTRTPI